MLERTTRNHEISDVYDVTIRFLSELRHETLAERIRSQYEFLNRHNIPRSDWPDRWPKPYPPLTMFLELIKILHKELL